MWYQIKFKAHFVGFFAVRFFWCSGRSSPAELPIHQLGRLQASGSTYTTSDTLKPSLPLRPCHFLCSLATWPLPLPSGLLPHFCFFLSTLILFPLLFGLLSSFSLRHRHSSLPFPPSRVMAVKQEQAHGRPLTGRPSESELCCRTKRLQTLARKYLWLVLHLHDEN